MLKAFWPGGRSSDVRSSSSSKSSVRRRTESKASSTVSRKSSRGDDRDRGLGDLSTYSSSGSRNRRYAPSAAGDSIASSYATAEPGSSIEFERNVIERAPRRKDTEHSERHSRYPDGDDNDDMPLVRRNRARSPSRERTRKHDANTVEVENGDRARSRRERQRTQSGDMYISPDVPTSGAGANFAPEMGLSNPFNPPAPFHNTHPVTSILSSPNVPAVYDPHVQQQFPGQFPALAAEPYRPPNPAGEAADYYGDQGQSVSQQPGVRPKPPAVIPNTQAHLMTASPSANPPPEPSSLGQVGAAAVYFEGDTDVESQVLAQPNKPPSRPVSKPPKPTMQTEEVLGPAAAATAHGGGSSPQWVSGSGSPPLPAESTPLTFPPGGTNTQKPPHVHGIGTTVGAAAVGATAGYMMSHHHQSSLSVENALHSSNQNYEEASANGMGYANPSMPPHQPNAVHYPAGTGEAAAYAAHPSHPHHAALYHAAPFQSGGLAFQQRQRGPLDRFLDFWRDSEGVGMFEDYTETIGVCKHCFEPGTSSRDAPRKHYYNSHRRPTDRYSNGSRVEKASRYSSSEDESRRYKKASRNSWLPGMLAKYTFESLFNNKDIEGTYSVRSGRVSSLSQDSESISAFERRSHTSRGVYRRSNHRSYEGSIAGDSRESRRRSRSRSRSSSRPKKHSVRPHMTLGVGIGTAPVTVSELRNRSRSRSQRRRKTKSRKSSSSDSSSLDISKPARKSVGGAWSTFFTATSENRRKRQAEKRRSIFSFNNSSSSSLDADLAFGSDSARKQSGKSKKRNKKKDRDDVHAALIGLGAVATKIAGSTVQRSRHTGEIHTRKESKSTRLDYTSSATNDDAWEDVDSSSVNSLAFGGSELFGSNDSQSSYVGPSLWSWGWGNKPPKKRKGRRRFSASEGPLHTNTAVTGVALGTAALVGPYGREGKILSEDTVSGTGSLQQLAPMPTSDLSHSDMANISSFPSQPALIRPGPIPLQQPQPVTPVSQAVYTSQGETIHTYTTAPSGPPPFGNILAHRETQPHSSRVGPKAQNISSYPELTNIPSKISHPARRRDSSPVFPTEPLEATLISSVKHRTTMKDQTSVQFDLTQEQAEKERRTYQLERLKRDPERQEGLQLIDRESEIALRDDERRSRRFHQDHRNSDYSDWEQSGRDCGGEKHPTSWVAAVTTGEIGAATTATVLSSQASFSGFSESTSSQRRYYERSEKRRAERRRMSSSESISSNLPMPGRGYDDIDQRPTPTHQEERIKKPVYTNYAQFFAPEELRYSPDTHARREPASMPTTIEPEATSSKATEEPHSGYHFLSGPVPELRLIEPTPPQSQIGFVRDSVSPTQSSPEVCGIDKVSTRPITGSRVSWGKLETHEYEIPSTSSEFESADQDFVTGPEQEKYNNSKSARDMPAIPTNLSKSTTSDYDIDIEFAATVTAATAAAGFGPSVVSVIREKLVSPSGAPHGYVESDAITPDVVKQPVPEKFIERGPLYSEPEPVSESDRPLHRGPLPSSSTQEVIPQRTGKQPLGVGELTRRVVEEANEDQQGFRFHDRNASSVSPPDKGFHMPGGFEPEESFGQQKPPKRTQEPTQGDSKTIVSAPIPGDCDNPTEVENNRKNSGELDTTERATSPAAEGGSTEEKKKRRKRPSKRDSDGFHDSISAISSPARIEETTDRRRSTEEKDKERKTSGLLSNIFGSKVSEQVASKMPPSSDSRPSGKAQSEVGSEESRRQRREGRRQQTHGELMELGKLTEREKDRVTSQDKDDELSFLAGSPEMPMQVGNADYEGASGRLPSTNTERKGLGLGIFENRSRSRSASPPASERAIDLSPKSQSRPTSPELARIEERNQDQQSRRSSSVRLMESPTAIPLHFRRPPSTSPRAHRSLSASSPAAPSPASPTGQRPRRPASGEFINSREMRPLWLVERHGNKVEAHPDEPLPSLPSSKTSSVNASAEDLPFLQDKTRWEKLDFSHSVHGDHLLFDADKPPATYYGDNPEHGTLDSEEETPTAASFNQTNTHQLIRKEKPKYEFHSPSELLHDPSTYVELPQSPTMGALPSAEGSAVGVKYVDSLPPLPVYRPSTPETKQRHASNAVESPPTQEQTAPDVEAPQASGDHGRSGAVDTSVAKVAGVDLLTLEEYGKGSAGGPSECMEGNIELGEGVMSHEAASPKLVDKVVAVLPDVQLPTTEPVEKVTEDACVQEDAAFVFANAVNVPITAAMGSTDEKHACLDEPLPAGATDEATRKIGSTLDGQTQLQDAQPEILPKPPKPLTNLDFIAPENKESLGNARVNQEYDPSFDAVKHASLEKAKGKVPVHGPAVTESAEPITGNAGKADEEAIQTSVEEFTVDVTAPSSSKKKKKARKKKGKNLELNDYEQPPLQDPVAAVPSASADVGKMDELTTPGGFLAEQNTLTKNIQTSAAEEEPLLDISKTDEEASKQAPVDMLVFGQEPVANVTGTEDKFVTEPKAIPEVSKNKNEVNVQKFEGESVFEPGSAVQAENLQTVVDSKPSLGPFKQEPVLRPPELNRAPLTADTLITGRISTSGLSITEVAPEAQMPEITTVPVQGSVMSIPNPDNTPITHAPTTEQVMPMHMPVTEKTHEGDLVSEKMLDSDALPASTSGETFADTDVFTKGLKRNKKRRKQGKGSDTGENNDGPSGMAVVESSQSAPEAVTTQATEEPSQLTIKDFQSIEESSLPTEENLTSNSEDPVQATTKGVESLQKPDESSQQDVLLLEKHAEHPVELALEEPSKEYPPPELQDSTEEYIPAEVEAPEVAHGPDQLNIAVPGQNAGAASLNGQGGGSAPAADPQERVAIVVSSSADFTPRTPPLEDKRHVSKEAEASAEPGSEQLPPEQQQTQDIPMLVEPTDTPELAGIVTESGAPRHDTGPASTPTEILLSRKSNKNDEKGENRENVEEPAVEKISDDVPRTGPADEGAIPQVEAEPTVPPNAEPETKQPEEVQDGKSGVTSHLPSETTPDVAADTSVEFQDTGSTESTQGANSEEALGVQSKTKGQKSKKNRKSISSSDSQAEANAENQPRLSSTEGLTTAETPLAKTSGVGELAATNETTRIEKEDPIPTVEYESNVPVPDIEPGEATLPGKKNKKKKKKKKQSVPPSAPDADPIAAESAEPSSRTEVANTKTDVPIAAEDPSTMKGQELDLEGTIGNEQSVALAEAAADAISPPMAPSITTAQRKKAKKDKKQRKPATPDELPTLEPAVVLNRAEDSLEQDSVPVGEPAPVQEPDEANDALIQEPTNINEVADEQPRNEELTDTDFVIVPKGGFDEKTEEPTQQEHNEISGDGSEVAAIDAAKVDLDQGQHTDHTPSRWEATLTNKEQPEVDDQSAEEQSTVKIAGIEQLATSENLFEADPVDDTLNTAPATNSEAAREQSQEEALSEKAAPERDGGDETSATNFFSQDAVDGGHEFSTPKKSKKDKKKKKKQQSLPLEEGQPAVVEEGSIEEPSGTLSDLAEVPEQQQRPVLDDDPQMPQNILPKEPVQELEAKEDGPAGPAEQAEAPRPAELGPTAESQTATAKKKAKKDKKKRKSMSFTTNEEEAPAQLPENIEVAESSEQFGEDSKTPEQPNIQMTEKSALAQPSREDAGSNISNEAQLTEAPANLPKDVLNTASELSGPTPTEAVAHGEQVTLPSTDSVIEAQTDTSGTVALYPMSQALPAAEELVDKTVVSQPEANTFDDARGSERPEDKEEEPDTGDLAPPNSGEVLPTPANSTPETSFSPPMQESTTVVEDAEQKTTPSKSKKDKKKKKRKTQESNDNEHSAAPEPDVEETPVQIEEVDNPATPEVSESNNVLKGPKTSSEDVPSFSLEPSADDTRTGAAQAVYSTGHDAKESERTEQQATEQSETPQDDGTPNMSAKEKRKAKKKEKKRQSKSLDGSNAALTGAESASLALEEKAQDPLENAEATFVEDVVRDATETQISSEMKPSDPSVYTGIPPVVEDDGKENQSRGTESHGENDKNLFWTDGMVSSQVDQQQATSLDSPSRTSPENIEIETVTASGKVVKHTGEIEVGTKDHSSTAEQEATSEVHRVSLGQLRAQDFTTTADEGGKALILDEDELGVQRDTTAETTGQKAMEDRTPAQTGEGLDKRDKERAVETPFTAAELMRDSKDDQRAAKEESVAFSPAETENPEAQVMNSSSASEIEKLEAAASSSKRKTKKERKKLRQARLAENSQQEEHTATERSEAVQDDTAEDATISESNPDSSTLPTHVGRQTEISGLQVISVEPGTESDEKRKGIAIAPKETRPDGVDLVPDSPMITEAPRENGTEETVTPESAGEPSSEIHAHSGDLLPVISNEENNETKAPTEIGEANMKTPALVDTVAECFESTNEKANLGLTQSSDLCVEPSDRDKEPFQVDSETVPKDFGREETKHVSQTAEGEGITQPLGCKGSKKQKTNSKKQAKKLSTENSDSSLPDPKREADAESSPDATADSTTITPANELSFGSKDKLIESQEMRASQKVLDVSNEASEATPATEIGLPISTECNNQDLIGQDVAVGSHPPERQGGEDKHAEVQTMLSGQTLEENDVGAAQELSAGHSVEQDTPVPSPSDSKNERRKPRQDTELKLFEQTEQPAPEGQTESTEEALFVSEAQPEEPGGPISEDFKAEQLPPTTSSRKNKRKSKGNLNVESQQPEEMESVSEGAHLEPSQSQYQFGTLVAEQSSKEDEWPFIDWEKGRVDVIEQTPQSSPETFAAPFEPDESAEAKDVKAIMGSQGEDSGAKHATTKPTVESAEYVAGQLAHGASDDEGSSIPDKQFMEEPGSVPQGQSKVASIFPDVERGSFRRPINTNPSQSVKDGAEDETIEEEANREDAMQVSEAPIATPNDKYSDHTTTATTDALLEDTTVHNQAPLASRSVEGNHNDSEDVRYTPAGTMEADRPVQEVPLYAPTPIHEQSSALINSSSNAMSIDRPVSPKPFSKVRGSPPIHGSNGPSSWPKLSGEDTSTPTAQASNTTPSSTFAVPSVVDKVAISPPRTPLQPIAEHEPVDRMEKTNSPRGTMVQGRGTPRLEMKPEHVLPRPETPVRKFTDNALARKAWPTLDKDEEHDLRVRKRGSARSIDRECPAEPTRTPEKGMPILRPNSVGSIKSVHSSHSQRSLRRMDRSTSGDLRAARHAQKGSRQSSCSPQPQPPVQTPLSDPSIESIASSSSYDPITDKGKRPLRAMTDVYEGWGETPSSPRSPSRPSSIRHRRSMQHLQELETRLDQLISENRLLTAAREAAEDKLRNASVARRKSDHALNERDANLRDREAEVEQLKNSVEWLQKEVSRLTGENEELAATNSNITVAHAAEIQTIQASSTRELEDLRLQNQQLSSEMQDRVRQEIDTALTQKNMELRRLREDLESARDKVKELQQQIAASMQDSVLVFRDEDYFDAACQKLCGHVQQWVLRFSKHSDLRRCRKLSDIQDEKIADRFENAILDGSDVDTYLSDRVRRRDVFMSVVMTMVWEFIFTRYLFGMDREQRQKLKSLEKQLSEVGPHGAVHRWRATTLNLLSKRPAFSRSRENDTEAVALEIFETLSRLLPPPTNVEPQLLESLRKVLRVAVNLSIEMRTQLAEYIMLPPLQPEYDTNGDLARQVYFNASLMNERSGETTSNEELESQQAVVRVVLFPLVVKKGNDTGEGEDEVVVCPAQVLVARPSKDKKVTRMLSGDRMSLDGTRSIYSIAPSSTMDMSNVI